MLGDKNAGTTESATSGVRPDAARYGAGRTPSEDQRIQAGGTSGIFISRDRFGGAGAVELRRGNRLQVFGGQDALGGLGEEIWVPDDPFDLSPIDEAAADQLTGALVVPRTVRPFQPFTISWEVTGPSSALGRVNSYQLNVPTAGPIFGLSSEASLTQNGFTATGSEIVSVWRSGSVTLWAHFGTGIREIAVTDIPIDSSDCTDKPIPLLVLAGLLETDGGSTFVERVAEDAGEDVTVTVTSQPKTSFSGDGFTFDVGLRLEGSNAIIDVELGMQFMIVPRAGHLAGGFASPGNRSVSIDANLPWYDDLWHTITLGKHNLSSYYGLFRDGLKELADGFAAAIARQVRDLPDPTDPDYEQSEAEADKAVAVAIDLASSELVVTLCPISSALVSVVGLFPVDTFKTV